jgi:molybdopterin-guanine dinucleotide biosynthesis protein
MHAEDPLKIISVTGAHSGVGKTTLCSILFENITGFGGIKFTKTSFYTSVIDDAKILSKDGKDTAIFFKSGAERVVWIQSPGGEELENALNIALSKMAGLKGVVIEGNSPQDFVSPDLAIFIIGEKGEIKPAASKVSKKADIIIVNSEMQIDNYSFLNHIPQEHRKVFWIDMLNKKGEIDKFIICSKKYIE